MDRPAGVVDFTPDPTLFPFDSRWFESSVGPIHYIDEGQGPALLMLHGNPDWSFIYRDIVRDLRADFRCVAADYPGFGLSAHPAGYGFTAAEHAGVIGELVEHLDLTELVVVGQDWGGPIGLDVASRRPDRIRGLVMSNTWIWPFDERRITLFGKLFGSRPMQWLIVNKNIFVTVLLKRMLLQEKLADDVFAHYTDVVPGPRWRKGIARFPRELLDARPWMADVEQRVSTALADTEAVLIFGREDAALGNETVIARWRSRFPHASVVELPGIGHYIHEEAPSEITAAIRARFG